MIIISIIDSPTWKKELSCSVECIRNTQFDDLQNFDSPYEYDANNTFQKSWDSGNRLEKVLNA